MAGCLEPGIGLLHESWSKLMVACPYFTGSVSNSGITKIGLAFKGTSLKERSKLIKHSASLDVTSGSAPGSQHWHQAQPLLVKERNFQAILQRPLFIKVNLHYILQTRGKTNKTCETIKNMWINKTWELHYKNKVSLIIFSAKIFLVQINL